MQGRQAWFRRWRWGQARITHIDGDIDDIDGNIDDIDDFDNIDNDTSTINNNINDSSNSILTKSVGENSDTSVLAATRAIRGYHPWIS